MRFPLRIPSSDVLQHVPSAVETVKALIAGAEAGEIVLLEPAVNLGLWVAFPSSSSLREATASLRAPNLLVLSARYQNGITAARLQAPVRLIGLDVHHECAEVRLEINADEVTLEPSTLASRVALAVFLGVARGLGMDPIDKAVSANVPHTRREGDVYTVDLREVPEVRRVLATSIFGVRVFSAMRLEGIACRDGELVIGVAGQTLEMLAMLRRLVRLKP